MRKKGKRNQNYISAINVQETASRGSNMEEIQVMEEEKFFSAKCTTLSSSFLSLQGFVMPRSFLYITEMNSPMSRSSTAEMVPVQRTVHVRSQFLGVNLLMRDGLATQVDGCSR